MSTTAETPTAHEINFAQREALRDQYEAGAVSLDFYVAEDERLARITGADAEEKMAPLFARGVVDKRHADKDRFMSGVEVMKQGGRQRAWRWCVTKQMTAGQAAAESVAS